jgi:hypothetical protein
MAIEIPEHVILNIAVELSPERVELRVRSWDVDGAEDGKAPGFCIHV